MSQEKVGMALAADKKVQAAASNRIVAMDFVLIVSKYLPPCYWCRQHRSVHLKCVMVSAEV